MRARLTVSAILPWACVLASCTMEAPDPTAVVGGDPDGATSVSAVIDASGGTIRLGDAAILIPAAALDEATEIHVSIAARAAPGAFAGYSPVYSFEPAGLRFEVPVMVTLPFDGLDEAATLFWTALGSDSFMALPTDIDEGRATAQINHFGDGFVGSGCEGDDCCDHANGELDVLLLMDNSNSMQEEQAALAEQLPRMARVLATGDLDDDGVQDFPALHSVRVGVVTSDMGSGGHTIMTCDEPVWGDDGVLRTTGNTALAECNASYPAFAHFGAEDDPAAIDDFVRHVECVGVAGTGGCGFEQQAEAMLKSVTPSTSAMRFAGGSVGHGDGVNAGFLRDESIVAFVMLTDEGDCSAEDGSIFDPVRDDMGPLNVRCALNQEALHPVSRYVRGLQDLRDDPADVIFSLIAGVPMDLVTDPGDLDYAAMLADPRMTHRINPTNPNELVPSCSTESGLAYPPRRMVEAAQGFGANGVVQSICQSDFTPAIAAILERVASRARGECL